MKTKDNVLKINENEAALGGCKINDKSCIIESFFSKVPQADILTYYNLLIDEKMLAILKDDELLNCLDCLFECDLNVALTSRKSFLHRNTLLYRLTKIQEATGLDLTKFSDAVTFKIVLLIYKAMR